MTDTPAASFSSRIVFALLTATACALLLGLSVFPPSSTRIYAWPWAGFAAFGWLLPISVALYRMACDKPFARFGGWLDAGFLALAFVATLSALTSPLRGAILPHLLPVFGICALPYSLLPWLQPNTLRVTLRISASLLAVILTTGLLLWLQERTAGTRNAQPFGHANITGSVAVLATTWFAFAFIRETHRGWRVFFALGTLLAIVTAVGSGSRGAVLAIASGVCTAGTIALLRRGRLTLFVVLLLVIVAAAAASNTRLRELALHGRWSTASRASNDQRMAMALGGLQLGAERPLTGWGAGSVPHVFPRVRGPLPGDADNFLQLHNTPAQLWATLGSLGLLAALLIATGLLSRLRSAAWTPERITLAAALAAAATLLLFDHPFATPVFAVLASAHLAAWAASSRLDSNKFILPLIGLVLLLLAPALCASARDLSARRSYSNALDHAVGNDPAGYAAALTQSARLAPSDPYYLHLLAAFHATGHPIPGPRARNPAAAISLLTDSLKTNPDLEYAHYNLGWLLLDSAPQTAAGHFREAIRLSPQRGAVYLGLGLARIHMDDTDGAVRTLATEWLLNPATAWSPVWKQPPLAALIPRIRALATETARTHLAGRDPWVDLAATPLTSAVSYYRMRTGYGVLMGHPEGLPPIDFNTQQRIILPPELRTRVPKLGWLDGETLVRFLETPMP